VVLPNGKVRLYGINSREGRMLMLIADPYVRFNDTRYHEDTRYDEEGN
jgi:hypothetical protein